MDPMPAALPVENPVVVFAIVASLILLAPVVMARWRLPGTVGLLLAGALLGPHAFGVLARDQSFVLFGTVGLLYIMFTAALEIDLAVLKRYRVHGVVFGLLTFAIPQGVGALVAHYILRFDWMTAILLASLFASHTLIAYPVASRLGLSRNQAVTTAVGGTIVTDTLALLVLAVIAGASRGAIDEGFWLRLSGALMLYFAAILIGLPMLGRWFFRKARHDGVAEFVFVLAAVFGCASLAHLFGSEPVVGAFLAGLALNRLIPQNGVLMNRIRFTGDAIFIPFFLLWVGMLLDVSVFAADLRAWAIALGMVGTVVLTKWLAAQATRPLLGYGRAQARVVFGLSVAQAAGTLAATMVGYEIGLFDDAVVNGAILMILVTCILAPWQVHRHGRELALAIEQEAEEVEVPSQRVMVALSDRTPADPLVELALLIRDPAAQQPVFPVTVVEDGAGAGHKIRRAEQTLAKTVGLLAAADVPSRPLTRIDLNLASGILRARRELRGTDVIMGWSARTTSSGLFFGSVLESMLEERDYTLLLARQTAPLASCGRILFIVPPNAEHEAGFASAVRLVTRLAHQMGAGLLAVVASESEERVRRRMRSAGVSADVQFLPLARWSGLLRGIDAELRPDDALVLCGVRVGGVAWRPAMGSLRIRLAMHFPGHNLVVVYPPAESDEALLSSGTDAVPSGA
jgi:Kef-type K+ transport system membrane component KefB